jgi:spore germination cell wall hydrolase CwlJ-like protein
MVPSSKIYASPVPQAEPAAIPHVQTAAPEATQQAVLRPEAQSAQATPPQSRRDSEAHQSAADVASVSDRELDCLTRVILYESGAESRAGQLAVADVVLNRVQSPRFPDTICGVIYQRGQFSSIRSFNPPQGARWQRARAVALDAIDDGSTVGRALYFHATSVRPAYVQNRPRVAQIGNHIFYR